MNARRTPRRVLSAHLTNKVTQFAVDLGPSCRYSRLPPPPSPIARTVPADHRFWPDDLPVRFDERPVRNPQHRVQSRKPIALAGDPACAPFQLR
jgi:hypothetical protein